MFYFNPLRCQLLLFLSIAGVDLVLQAIIDRLPSPKAASQNEKGPFLGRVVDSWFDEHRGVICLIQAVAGKQGLSDI